AEEERPHDRIARICDVLQRESERGHAGGEGETGSATARRRLRVRDHEEREEKQAAGLELVQQHGGALAKVEDANGAQHHPGTEEGEAHVAAEGAVRDGAPQREYPEQQQRTLAPLRRRAPCVRREQHTGAEAEVRWIQEMTPAD